jgi:hypothetical protein
MSNIQAAWMDGVLGEDMEQLLLSVFGFLTRSQPPSLDIEHL